MSFIPLIPSLADLAATVMKNKAAEEANKNYSSSLFSIPGCGSTLATDTESDAKMAEIKQFVESAMGPTFYHSFWEMFTAIIAPIAASVGIPYFICKNTIAKMVVDSIMGKPDYSIPSYTPNTCTPPTFDEAALAASMKDPLATIPSPGSNKKGKPSPKRKG